MHNLNSSSVNAEEKENRKYALVRMGSYNYLYELYFVLFLNVIVYYKEMVIMLKRTYSFQSHRNYLYL